MFLHYGISTYDGIECSPGTTPAAKFAPDQLNINQWLSVARDAGMTYAVLTAKHVAGFCLWPSKHTDYHVGNSPVKTDLVEQFVTACHQHSILPALYYCSWDNHHKFGSVTPSMTFLGYPGSTPPRQDCPAAYTTQKYRDFQMAQIQELLTQYGPLAEIWIDIPGILGPDGRLAQYNQIASLQPDTLVVMNQGITDGSKLVIDYAWPTDILTIERPNPSSTKPYNPLHNISPTGLPAQPYYLPAEVCDPIGHQWFYVANDPPKPDADLLSLRKLCHSRNANLLLDVPPDPHGLIPQPSIDSLTRLQSNFKKQT
jgi:alpha-L-fucosidase